MALIAISFFATIFLFGWLGTKLLNDPQDGIMYGFGSIGLVSAIAMCYDIAKTRVQRENEELMKQLKDSK
jgi:hypothetical protein